MKSALIGLIALLGATQTGGSAPATYLSDAELMAATLNCLTTGRMFSNRLP